MKRAIVLFTFVLSGLGAAPVMAATVVKADASGCFSFRGRLEMAAAAPRIRIFRIDKKDMLGVADGPRGHENDAVPANVRTLLRPDLQTKLFGDFDVCPLAGAAKGQVQMVRIQKITVVAVMNPQKPDSEPLAPAKAGRGQN